MAVSNIEVVINGDELYFDKFVVSEFNLSGNGRFNVCLCFELDNGNFFEQINMFIKNTQNFNELFYLARKTLTHNSQFTIKITQSDKSFEIVITKKSLIYVKDIFEKDLYEVHIPSYEEISKVSEIISLSCNSAPVNTPIMFSFFESINGEFANTHIVDLVNEALLNASENQISQVVFSGKKGCIYGHFKDNARSFILIPAKVSPNKFDQSHNIVCFHSDNCNIWNVSSNSVFSPFFDLTLNQINLVYSAIKNGGCIKLKKHEMIGKGIRFIDEITENDSVELLFGSAAPFHDLLENIYKP